MRLNCEVAVQSWSSTQGVVSRRKPTQASISLGRKPGRSSAMSGEDDFVGTVFLLLSTANNVQGTKYKIYGNIANVFGKFVREGKATIRFKEPTHELCLSKADPPSLYKFLATLKISIKDNKNVKLPTLTAVKRSEVQKVKTDLMIFGRNEYLKTTASYPAGLQKLSVVNCSLIRFDIRILTLRHLVVLNLSQNNLKQLDFSLERLKSLRTLNLSSNQLTRLPSKICRTCKLISLDLSNNQLSCLPVAFSTMTSLVNVKLQNNRLSCLPGNIAQLTNLRSLNISNNELVILPLAVETGLNLDMLDISGNSFAIHISRQVDHNYLSDTLQERAGRVIKNTRIYYSQNVVGRILCDYLDSVKLCSRCAQSCFSCIHNAVLGNPTNMAREIITSPGEQLIPAEAHYCSSSCFRDDTL